jgi:hypothetical protein
MTSQADLGTRYGPDALNSIETVVEQMGFRTSRIEDYAIQVIASGELYDIQFVIESDSEALIAALATDPYVPDR